MNLLASPGALRWFWKGCVDEMLYTRDFNENPFIVIWEVTRACQLHCMHCRAEAQRHRDPRELTTIEGLKLIDGIAAMAHPLLVFTGGDPLEREDLFEFIAHAKARGLEVAMTPSATPRVTKEKLALAKEAGLSRCAFSLDGSVASIHDRFRGTKGSYDLTIGALDNLRELGLPIQLNTTVSRYNVDDLPRIADIAQEYNAALWSLFFLVPTGRGREQDMVSAETAERIMEWLYEQARVRSFGIKTTAAPHYRRVVLQHQKELLAGASQLPTGRPDLLRPRQSVNDGNGFVFISHIGDVYPSGFLPVNAGNVRQSSLSDIYRNDPIFQALRDSSMLKGRCGACEFKAVCGGSRARAYAMTGDYLQEDPACAYQPLGEKKLSVL